MATAVILLRAIASRRCHNHKLLIMAVILTIEMIRLVAMEVSLTRSRKERLSKERIVWRRHTTDLFAMFGATEPSL